LVFIVALTEGPLISFQSLILVAIGLVTLLILISKFAKAIDLVDIPDNFRRDHMGKIPLAGGIGLYISFIYGTFVFGVDSFYIYLLISLIPIMIIGIIDGLQGYSVSPVYRLIGQTLASLIVIATTDIYVRDLGDIFGLGNIFLGGVGIPFTIFGVVGICNAFNMLDGKDGLLGSVSVLIMGSLLLLLYFNGIIDHWIQVVVLSIIVFLAFNLSFFGRKRKIFLGDHGSNGLGYIIAWELVYLSQETTLVAPVSAIWFVFLPLTDALLTFFRRVRSSNSIFDGDRLHLHHILSDKGYSDGKILLIFSVITFISCSIAIAVNLFKYNGYILFYSYITILVFSMFLTLKVRNKE